MIHSWRLFKAIQEENEYTNTQRQFAFQWYEFPSPDNEVIKTFDLNISSLCFDNHYFWTFEWWGGNLEWGNVWKILLIAPQNGKYYNWRKNVLCKTQEFIALAVWFCVYYNFIQVIFEKDLCLGMWLLLSSLPNQNIFER